MGVKRTIFLPLSVGTPMELRHICYVLAAIQLAAETGAGIIPIVTDLESAECEDSWQRGLSWIGQALDSEETGPFLFKSVYRQSERVSMYRKYLSEMKLSPGYEFFLKKDNSFGTKSDVVSFNADTFFSNKSKFFEPGTNTGQSLYLRSVSVEQQSSILIWNSNSGPSTAFAAYVDCIDFSMSGLIMPNADLRASLERLGAALGCEYKAKCWYVPKIVSPAGENLSEFSQNFFQSKGFLPHALIAWLVDCQLESSEVKPLELSLERLDELNSGFLENLDLKTIVRFGLPFLRQKQVGLANRKQVFLLVDVLRGFFTNLDALAVEAKRLLCAHRFDFDEDVERYVRRESSKIVLWSFLRQLDEYEDVRSNNFPQIMQQIQLESGVIGKDLWRPIRLVLTGVETEYDLAGIVEILGREICLKRLRAVLGDYW